MLSLLPCPGMPAGWLAVYELSTNPGACSLHRCYMNHIMSCEGKEADDSIHRLHSCEQREFELELELELACHYDGRESLTLSQSAQHNARLSPSRFVGIAGFLFDWQHAVEVRLLTAQARLLGRNCMATGCMPICLHLLRQAVAFCHHYAPRRVDEISPGNFNGMRTLSISFAAKGMLS